MVNTQYLHELANPFKLTYKVQITFLNLFLFILFKLNFVTIYENNVQIMSLTLHYSLTT